MAKNIVVFADGTGNSSAKLFKTNVWRLYQALDTTIPPGLGNPVQLAYYDDGVGTSSFRPLAFLGGAFGWGLKRNVLDCYKFICRNYQPGDRIYLFGFSRGAFTARILAGFISKEGLVEDTGYADLELHARNAYRLHRAGFKHWLAVPLRKVRDSLSRIKRCLTGRLDYDAKKTRHPDQEKLGNGFSVEFIGVWDTVAAYGMPIAEMTRGFDKWVWPLSMPDYLLSPKVKTARHALALDDERDTFHPVLWDEINSENPGRIKQVWFAGMHSDVGGGYPDDTLSYKPLEWMLDEATRAGLVFAPSAIAEIQRMACSVGPGHDSRHGLAGYYRYQPRKISARINPPDPTTLLMRDPKRPAAPLRSVNIHASVLERIATGNDRYAPIVLNGDYTIVPSRRGLTPPSEITPLQRALDQERIWDWVWHKRVNYFLSLAVSLCLAGFPLLHYWLPPSACSGPQCLLSPVISTIGEFVPGFAQPWIAAFAATPGWTTVFVVILALLLARSGNLQDRIRTEMRALWEQSLGLPTVTVSAAPPTAWVRRLRSSPSYQRGLQCLKWKMAPFVFGVVFLTLIFSTLVVIPGAFVLRSVVWINENGNQQCIDQKADKYETRMTCYPLRKRLAAGERYRVTVAVTEPWADETISTSPEGFGPTRMNFLGNLAAPLRRSPSARWFQPLIKIVPPTGFFRLEPLEMRLTAPAKGIYTAEFVAPIAGDAYFFVNDVSPVISSNFYSNNHGKADVHIEACVRDGCSLP